jgi:hypothetical protein
VVVVERGPLELEEQQLGADGGGRSCMRCSSAPFAASVVSTAKRSDA